MCGSTRGGVTRLPPRSMVSAAVVSASTATILPRSTPRSASASCPATRALRRSRSIIWLTMLLIRVDPDAALVHQVDLPGDHLAPVVLVRVRGPVEVQVLRVDRLFVDDLVLLGGQVLDPVVPLGVGAEPAQRLDVDGAGHPG